MGALEQIAGWWANFKAALIRLKPPDFLPPSISGLIDWILLQLSYSVGIKGEPYRQIVASTALAIAFYLSSLSPAIIITLPLAIFFSLMVLMGIFRWFPAVNSIWSRLRPPLARLYDRFVDLVWNWDA